MDTRRTRQKGFSLLELLICLVVMMVVTVAAFPTINKTLQIFKLQSSAQDVATLLQRARILAVRNNTTYSILFTAPVNGFQEACIDTNWNGVCDPTEPNVALARNVSLVTDGSGVSPAQITCGALTTNCPAGFTGLNYQQQGANVPASYNDRGLPCIGTPANAEPLPNNTACKELVNNTPTGFLYKFQYQGANGTTYAAVTVTPSALVGVWLYSGTAWGQQ